MTESEWLAETEHPYEMFEQLETPLLFGRLSVRRWQLLKCALARRVWDSMTDLRSRTVLESAEQHADGLISSEQLTAARTAAFGVHRRGGQDSEWHGDSRPEVIAARIAWAVPMHHASPAHWWEEAVFMGEQVARAKDRGNEENSVQCEILRDIFGNPFRPVTADPAWLTWNHATVPAIARHIYDDRAFHDLSILADALEDAGCTNADLLDHCRGPGPHVRGCWAVDLLLGKS